jgi:rubrerythrin
MEKKVSENIFDVLKNMEALERAVADLYLLCSQTRLFAKEFWADMGQAEINHARIVSRMTELISKKPESFELNSQFKSAAIKTATSGIRWHMDRLKKNEMTEEKMLYIARDLELAVLENCYNSIVKTSNSEFHSLMGEIVSDTVAHHDQLERRIKPLTPSRS